jgi:hypothetical protein
MNRSMTRDSSWRQSRLLHPTISSSMKCTSRTRDAQPAGVSVRPQNKHEVIVWLIVSDRRGCGVGRNCDVVVMQVCVGVINVRQPSHRRRVACSCSAVGRSAPRGRTRSVLRMRPSSQRVCGGLRLRIERTLAHKSYKFLTF